MLADPALARSLGERGLARAREFDWHVVVDQIEAAYREVTARQAAR